VRRSKAYAAPTGGVHRVTTSAPAARPIRDDRFTGVPVAPVHSRGLRKSPKGPRNGYSGHRESALL